jgi:hypothetical protein
MNRLTIAAALALLSGCSTLRAIEPNTIAPEIEHVSHATQHQPFTNDPQHYGANLLNLTANWNFGQHAYLTLAEGIDMDRRQTLNTGETQCGEIMGPREEFSLRAGWRFVVKQ